MPIDAAGGKIILKFDTFSCTFKAIFLPPLRCRRTMVHGPSSIQSNPAQAQAQPYFLFPEKQQKEKGMSSVYSRKIRFVYAKEIVCVLGFWYILLANVRIQTGI